MNKLICLKIVMIVYIKIAAEDYKTIMVFKQFHFAKEEEKLEFSVQIFGFYSKKKKV